MFGDEDKGVSGRDSGVLGQGTEGEEEEYRAWREGGTLLQRASAAVVQVWVGIRKILRK